jgi:sec-independent protein translocase protein TatC
VKIENRLRGVATLQDLLMSEGRQDLTQRLFNIVLVTTIAFAACWNQREACLGLLLAPLADAFPPPIYQSTAEQFRLAMGASLVSALLVAAPFNIREIWMIAAPAPYRQNWRCSLPFFCGASTLFYAGVAFSQAAFPLEPALGIQPPVIPGFYSWETYADLLLNLQLLTGIAFVIPAVVSALGRIGMINGTSLLKHFRHALLLAVIIAGMATPTRDLPNQLMFALVILVPYAGGIAVAHTFGRAPNHAGM